MSFILDALKKSEAERQRQLGPMLLEVPEARPVRSLPRWAALVGLVLVCCVLVLGWLAWRLIALDAVRAARTTAAAATPAAPAPPAARAPPAAPVRAVGTPAGAAAVSGPVLEAMPAAPPAPAPAAGNRAAAPAPPVAAAAPPSANLVAENPADDSPAVAPDAGEPAASGSADSLHNYSELGGTVPQLRLDLHVYAARPADRYAFINMHRVREGDLTAEGVQVKQITREGVVLEFRGTEFLLGRQ
jgi:general secretion pathway protein B